jgi:FixJ family two-component response regulator
MRAGQHEMPETCLLMVHVIDDDEAVRDSLEALLIVAGYDVATYVSAEAYLAGAAETGCVLVDVHMPGMGGLGLLQRLARREPRPPVVVLTAGRDPRLEARARELGADAFLTKPVPQATLLGALCSAEGRTGHPLS